MAIKFSCLMALLLTPVLSQVQEHTAALQAVPPWVSLSPPLRQAAEKSAVELNPFVTNALMQAFMDQQDFKKRVQRYRDITI